MAKFDLKINWLNNIIKASMLDSVLFLQGKILEITPRDPKRPPKDPSQPITGNLKRSVVYQEDWDFDFKIWTAQWMAEYWADLEFWTVYMKPRSFLRKWIADNKQETYNHFSKIFNRLTKW